MGYDLIWEEWQMENMEEDFGSQAVKNLRKALEEKKRQIEWSEDLSDISRRFHNTFGLDGLQIAEIEFSSMSGDYRAICIVVPEEEAVFFYTVVPKKGSHQERQLELLRKNADEISEFIRESIDGQYS